MKKSIAIFKRDLLRLLRNPIALAIALGVAIVPCLYAWLNIASNWDPYENTSTIPVAVVSEDKPVTMAEMGSICVGDMLIEQLADNDKIGWTFPKSEDEALENVKLGNCYAAIVIPADFTKNLTGVMEGKTNKAHLKYYANEKVNAIAPKVTDTGASTVETTIDEQFVAVAGEVIAEKLGSLADKLTVGVDEAAESIATALNEAHTALENVDGQLDGLSQKLENAQTSLGDASDKLKGLQGKGTEAGNAIGDALNGFDQTRTNARNLMVDISNAMGSGSSTISSLASQGTYDISSLAGDIGYAQSQVNAAITKLERDLTDNEALTTKVTETLTVVQSLDPQGDSGAADTKTLLEQQLSEERDVLVNISNSQSDKLDELRGIASRLEAAAEEVRGFSKNVDNKVQDATKALQNAQTEAIGTDLNEVDAALDSFVGVAKQLETAARLVDPVVSQTVDVATQLKNTLEQTNGALASTRASLGGLMASVDELTRELEVIRTSDTWTVLKGMATTNPAGVKEFLSAPVAVSENRLYPVANYGTGVAPFFTSVALWVGCIALVAVFKLEVDDEGVGKVRPWQAYFGRWLLFVLLAALCAVVCCTGDLLLGIQCDYPVLFYVSAIVASFAFVNVVFALSVAFKHLGKAIAFTLIILQVPGSAGMYPIEMMPPFFQAIGPWLPFTYSNNAMREAIAGLYGTNLAYNLFMLLLFVLPSILVGVTARSHLVNINSLFDRRLRETDHLMVSEVVPIEDDRFRLATVVKAMHDPQEYREIFEERSAAFEAAYPTLLARGVVALMVIPAALFVLALAIDDKLPLIAGLALALIAIYIYIIVVEYFHDRIIRKRVLTELSPEELEEVFTKTLRDELMPYASIDAIIERRRKRRAKSVIGKVHQRVAQRIEQADERGEAEADETNAGAANEAGEAAETTETGAAGATGEAGAANEPSEAAQPPEPNETTNPSVPTEPNSSEEGDER
ncbi:MAG: YhgE/Pip domain-containing protein [Atopobiaceae bacterium]|nr:YhgE/Pip domain-containing protein [Atopobiaceae bacterium]